MRSSPRWTRLWHGGDGLPPLDRLLGFPHHQQEEGEDQGETDRHVDQHADVEHLQLFNLSCDLRLDPSKVKHCLGTTDPRH